MTTIIEALASLSGPLVYIIIGALAFSEAAAFVGLVLPGETALFLGGTIASQKLSAARIRAQWADMLRVVGSLHKGPVAGYDLLRMLGPRRQPHPARGGVRRIWPRREDSASPCHV